LATFRNRDAEKAIAKRAGNSAVLLREAAFLGVDKLLEKFDTSAEGLSGTEVAERLALYGPNTIAHNAPKSVLMQLLERFATPITLLLLGLAVIEYVTGEVRGAIVIALMVLLSVVLSFVQEQRSSKAAEKLRAMVSTTATVLRKGVAGVGAGTLNEHLAPNSAGEVEVSIDRLVPGDVIHLSAGDMVPADMRLISARDLFVSEAALTGEAMPVEKFTEAGADSISSVLELRNICFMGTNVISGAARGVVVNTGNDTYFGSVAAITVAPREQTSFDKGINQFTWLMIRFMLVMVPLVFFINGLTKGNWTEAFLFAVAVAVGLTPEMLPMIVTINLAKGAIAMARKKVIVKRLAAIQNFGAMDVLCTDKTGTLTQDKVILEKHVDIHGHENERVLEYAYLNSFYQSGLKNLLDVAVLEHVEVHEHLEVSEHFSKIDEIPFDFQRRRMSVVVEKDRGQHILICKGAVEEVFTICNRAEEADGSDFELTQSHYDELIAVKTDLNEDGFRVIAVAYKQIPPAQTTYSVKDESDLVLVGYIAFLDPPKESASAAISVLNRHGVAVKILTGDNEIVTRQVCRQVGLSVDRVLLGRDMETMSDVELAEAVELVTVFAKLAPQQKARVIMALHMKGHVVGFLGDGINDGPAIRAADVGISVDSAVDIAKESADIILLEKNLLVLQEGVSEGRRVFGNIIKYIKMGASSNFGNMFSVLGASAFLPFLPMAPVQILLNNLLYDFSQTSVATDNVDREYLEQPRQWDIANIGRFMLFIGPISSIFDYATFFTLLYAFGAWSNPELFQTGWFVESLLSQTLIVHVIRTGKVPFLQSKASPPLMVTTLSICAVGVWLPYSQFAQKLGFAPLPGTYWPILSAILLGYLMLTQLVKGWLVRRYGLN